MTLSELKSKFFSRPSIAPPTTIYLFETKESADSWIECKYFGSHDDDYILTGVICSDMVMEYMILPKWCNAEVQQFYAVEPDVLVAVVEAEK